MASINIFIPKTEKMACFSGCPMTRIFLMHTQCTITSKQKAQQFVNRPLYFCQLRKIKIRANIKGERSTNAIQLALQLESHCSDSTIHTMCEKGESKRYECYGFIKKKNTEPLVILSNKVCLDHNDQNI